MNQLLVYRYAFRRVEDLLSHSPPEASDDVLSHHVTRSEEHLSQVHEEPV